mgnify:CR=1 FL=1
MNTPGERFGLLNQSTFDDSMITEDQSTLVDNDIQKTKISSSNTGKWKTSDLVGDPKMVFDKGGNRE